jgi:hypothetical protein
MKKPLLLITILLIGLCAQAQYYQNSAGIRTGYTSAITYKHFLKNEQAIELMASGRNDGIQITTLYEFHKPMELSFNDNFFAYYGVGASVGYEKLSRRTFENNLNGASSSLIYDRRSYFAMGVNTILGVEYRWLAMPLTIGLDIKPQIQFIDMQYTDTRFWDMGFSVKYVF